MCNNKKALVAATMNTSGSRSFVWLRFCLYVGLVLVVLGAVSSRIMAVPLDGAKAKVLPQTLSEQAAAKHVIEGDLPEPQPSLLAVHSLAPESLPLAVGKVQVQQFSSMVHRLRDRLMHAPPALL